MIKTESWKNIFSSRKIKLNEQCPCGSGRLFKDCCNGKLSKPNNSKKPPEVQIMEKVRSSLPKCCMHPDHKQCRGPIKAAHALQNNKIISLLAGTDRHVYIMDSKKAPLLIPLDNGEIVPIVELGKTSANKATTETCFCDYHDNVVFAPIEKGAPEFDSNSEEMKFVYAYKAFIFEYYKQWVALDIQRTLFKEYQEAFSDPKLVAIYRMLVLKQSEFQPIKKHFDQQILQGTHQGIFTCSISIPEQIEFANYAFIAPSYDMNGKKIKHTIKGVMHRLAITIFPEENKSWILLSCLETEKSIFEKLFHQFETSSIEKIKYYINLTLPLYSENMVLSTKLWDSWGEETQMAYTHLANLTGKDAMIMMRAIGFGLQNISKAKNPEAYQKQPKTNLFS